jgi:hypothetical protein
MCVRLALYRYLAYMVPYTLYALAEIVHSNL